MEHAVRVRRQQTPTTAWTLASRRPHPALAETVWNLVGYRERGLPSVRHELPFGGVVLVVNVGAPIEVGYAGARACTPERFGSFVAGLHDAPALTAHAGAQEGVQAYLSPLGAHALLRLPMHELANRTVALEDVLGRDGARLEARLAEAGSWAARLGALEGFLLARLHDAPDGPPDVARAWRRLWACDGRLEVNALAAELGCSRRHLGNRFRETIGLPPKVVGRILRFRATLDGLPPQDGRVDWARVAAAGGYADQSHLIRDFRAFAGTTPGGYLRARTPGLTAAEL